MASEHWTDRLSAYIDGELDEGERAELELHLLACPRCAELLVELREVVGEAAALGDRAPARDLWPGIVEGLTPRAGLGPTGTPAEGTLPPTGVGVADGEAVSLGAWRRRRPRRIAVTVPQLLAAGIALVVLSAGAVWMALSPGAGASAGPIAAGSGAGPGAGSGDAVPVTFTAAYEEAVAELEAAFEQQRERLDPETIRVVERNLAIIDAAIAEARHALEEDPASGFLNTHLASAMRRKVDLLRQATRIERTEI